MPSAALPNQAGAQGFGSGIPVDGEVRESRGVSPADSTSPAAPTIEIRPLTFGSPEATALLTDYVAEVMERERGEGRELDMRSAVGTSVEAHVEDFNRPNGEFLGAYVNGDLVGIGGVRVEPNAIAEIKRMYVAPSGRGLGLGRRLLQSLEAVAMELGCLRVHLDTRSILREARSLYESSGYEETDAYNDNPFAQHWFEKVLIDLREFALQQGVPAEDLPTADPDPNRRLALHGPLNFRDVGGYASASGNTVRRAMLFRSDHLHALSDADRQTMQDLDIRVIHDFRLDMERDGQPSAVDPDAQETVLLTMSDTRQMDTSVIEIVRDAFAGKGPLPPASYWEDSYESLLDVGRPMFVTLIESLTRGERLPALYHCTGGKDRTGLATAIILRLLGVDDNTIIDDFLLTNLYRTPQRIAALRPTLLAAGVDIDQAIPVLGVTRAAIVKALHIIDTVYGGPETYLVNGGLDPARIDVLRQLLLEPGPAPQ